MLLNWQKKRAWIFFIVSVHNTDLVVISLYTAMRFCELARFRASPSNSLPRGPIPTTYFRTRREKPTTVNRLHLFYRNYGSRYISD